MKIDSSEWPTQRPKMILYDWDNTLADSWRAILAGMNNALVSHNMPAWTLEQMKERARLSMRDSFPALFGEDNWKAARDLFYAGFRAVHLQELRALDGAEALLSAASALTIPQAVVSNKQGPFVRAEAKHLGWGGYFQAVIGAGDAARDKPNPEPVSLAMAQGGLVPGPGIWFVGDSYVDIAVARNTGLTPVLIHPGPERTDEFDNHPPAAHFTNLDAFKVFLTGLSQ